jgi:aminoglycoside phosphotransferase family enzyme
MARSRSIPRSDAVFLSEKLAFLAQAGSYPEGTSRVDAMETHMSWVFLTDHHAYKIKKPVRYDFLDFSTLQARRLDCEKEMRLNRRLAASVYLDVVPVTLEPDGALKLNGAGETVEWLVKMRRLSDDDRLDTVMGKRHLRPEEREAVAILLANFYVHATPVSTDPATYRRKYEKQIKECTADLLALGDDHTKAAARRVSETLWEFVRRDGALLDARAKAERIIEGHGDLRPEHVFLETPPVIIDCLEFSRFFSDLDPAEELSYLAMECELLDGQGIGDALFRVYTAASGDTPPPILLDFYKAYRAFVRAKLAICHLKDEDIRDHGRWQEQAALYLRRALTYLHILDGAES